MQHICLTYWYAVGPASQSVVRWRIALGLWQERVASLLGVDPSTLAKWEWAERKPAGRFVELVKCFLDDAKTEDADIRCAGYERRLRSRTAHWRSLHGYAAR